MKRPLKRSVKLTPPFVPVLKLSSILAIMPSNQLATAPFIKAPATAFFLASVFHLLVIATLLKVLSHSTGSSSSAPLKVSTLAVIRFAFLVAIFTLGGVFGDVGVGVHIRFNGICMRMGSLYFILDTFFPEFMNQISRIAGWRKNDLKRLLTGEQIRFKVFARLIYDLDLKNCQLGNKSDLKNLPDELTNQTLRNY
ncbi:hypothetical protein C1645_818186 [Glomus cerebriforme]|uniref:Uncharacterized protein n=1 Tax=Glomus cerebriforme TaxID=658196 RepID=A0A397TH89_9GLOM|nr:hypothetical protein C1645_818186 [Glomus cerebriforme]